MRRLLAAVSVFVVGLVSTGCCCPCPTDLTSLGAYEVARARGDVAPTLPTAPILAQSH